MISTTTLAILAAIGRPDEVAAYAARTADRRAHYVKKAVRAEERAAYLRGMGRAAAAA